MRSINHIISLKICKERSDRIILPKLTNQSNFIIRTLKWIVNKRYFFIQCSQWVLYVHARRVLSIHTCMTFILRETRTTVREWACCLWIIYNYSFIPVWYLQTLHTKRNLNKDGQQIHQYNKTKNHIKQLNSKKSHMELEIQVMI